MPLPDLIDPDKGGVPDLLQDARKNGRTLVEGHMMVRGLCRGFSQLPCALAGEVGPDPLPVCAELCVHTAIGYMIIREVRTRDGLRHRWDRRHDKLLSAGLGVTWSGSQQLQ